VTMSAGRSSEILCEMESGALGQIRTDVELALTGFAVRRLQPLGHECIESGVMCFPPRALTFNVTNTSFTL
jgi:hypothetical protein